MEFSLVSIPLDIFLRKQRAKNKEYHREVGNGYSISTVSYLSSISNDLCLSVPPEGVGILCCSGTIQVVCKWVSIQWVSCVKDGLAQGVVR